MFSEEKIDFNTLIEITSKIFPLRQKIEEIYEAEIYAETYSSLQILRLYTLYCMAIENNEDKSFKLEYFLVKLKDKL